MRGKHSTLLSYVIEQFTLHFPTCFVRTCTEHSKYIFTLSCSLTWIQTNEKIKYLQLLQITFVIKRQKRLLHSKSKGMLWNQLTPTSLDSNRHFLSICPKYHPGSWYGSATLASHIRVLDLIWHHC